MEDFISEKHLERMRRKAKKLERAVILLSVTMLLFYVWLGYTVATQDNGISTLSTAESVIFIGEIVFGVAVLSVGTFLLLWLIIVKHSYEKFNSDFKSRYVLQIIGAIKGFDKLKYMKKGGFT